MACLLSTANADELRRLVEMNVRENNEWWLGGWLVWLFWEFANC